MAEKDKKNDGMPLANKMKKMKDSLRLYTYKEKGEEPDEVDNSVADDGHKTVAEVQTVKGKVTQSSATPDAQNNGDYEKAVTAAGGKKKDINLTTVSGAVEQANENEIKSDELKKAYDISKKEDGTLVYKPMQAKTPNGEPHTITYDRENVKAKEPRWKTTMQANKMQNLKDRAKEKGLKVYEAKGNTMVKSVNHKKFGRLKIVSTNPKKDPVYEKGVHAPIYNKNGTSGVSHAGLDNITGDIDSAKLKHFKKLTELQSMPNPKLEKSDFPKSIGALHMDRELDHPEIAKHHIRMHEQAAHKASDPASKAYHRDQAHQIYGHMTGEKPYKQEVTNLDKSKGGSFTDADDQPQHISHLHSSGDLYNRDTAMKHMKMHQERAKTATSETSRAYHNGQASDIWGHISGEKPYKGGKGLGKSDGVDASASDADLEKSRDLVATNASRLFRQAGKKRKMAKAEPLQKDVVKLDPSKKKPGRKFGKMSLDDMRANMKKPHMGPTGSREDKIKAALQAQGQSGEGYGGRDRIIDHVPADKTKRSKTNFTDHPHSNVTRISTGQQDNSNDQENRDIWDKIAARMDDPETEQYVQSLRHASHDEPYIGGDLGNVAWRTMDKDHGRWNEPQPFPAKVGDLGGVLGKRVAQGGNDPFAWMDAKYGHTKSLLEQHHDKPLDIHTRSDLVGHDDYINAMNPKNHKIFMHVSTSNPEIQRRLEPGVASYKRRVDAIQKLRDRGFDVTMVHDKFHHDDPDKQESLNRMNIIGGENGLHAVGQSPIAGVKFTENHIPVTDQGFDRMNRATGIHDDLLAEKGNKATNLFREKLTSGKSGKGDKALGDAVRKIIKKPGEY